VKLLLEEIKCCDDCPYLVVGVCCEKMAEKTWEEWEDAFYDATDFKKRLNIPNFKYYPIASLIL
jgi:hypothetical protein